MLIYPQRKVTIWPRVPVDAAAADADIILVGAAGGIRVEELAGFGALMVTSTRLTVAASTVMCRSPSSTGAYSISYGSRDFSLCSFLPSVVICLPDAVGRLQ